MIDSAEPFDAFVPLRCGKGNEVVIYATGVQRYVFGQDRAVLVRLQELTPWIARVIQLRVGEDEKLADELFQVARFEIVRVDPSRLKPGDERWLKRRIAAAVRRACRKEMWFRYRIMGKKGDTPAARAEIWLDSDVAA